MKDLTAVRIGGQDRRWLRYSRRAFAVLIVLYLSASWRQLSLSEIALLTFLPVLLAAGPEIAAHCVKHAPPSPSWYKHRGSSLTSGFIAITKSELEHHHISSQRIERVRWNDIVHVEVVRDEDPWGDLGHWQILKRSQYSLYPAMSIWGESDYDREKLLRACERYLPGFSREVAERAFATRDVGNWVCFERGPVNYRSLNFSATGIEYETLAGATFAARWDEIETVSFCRVEITPADAAGRVQTLWLLTKTNSQTAEVPDEWASRKLCSAFRTHLPEFDFAQVRRGMHESREKGSWLCFQRTRASVNM